MTRVVLSGYFGYGNLGDEAILAATLAGLKARDIAPVVCSASPRLTAQTYEVEAVKRTNPVAVSKALMSAQCLVQGGGSLIQDATSFRSPLFYLAQLTHALTLATPFMIFAQGIGPLNRAWVHWLTRETLVHARALALRDPESYRWALANLPSDLPISLTADVAYLLEPCASDRLEGLLFQAKIDVLPQPFTLVAIKGDPKNARELYAWTEALNAFGRDFGGTLLLCPFFAQMDLPFYRALQPALTGPNVLIPKTWLPAEVLALTGECAFAIAGRLHPLIFAANRRVPFAAISYDPKMGAAAAEFGQQPIAQRSLIGFRTLLEGLVEASEDEGWTRRYDEALPGLRERAALNFQILEGVLTGTLVGSRVPGGYREP